MPSTLATASFGINFKLGSSDDHGSATHTTVAEVGDLNFSLEAQIEDVTSHSSSDRWRRVLPTLLSMSPIEMQLNWVPATATHNPITGLLYVWRQGLERSSEIVFPQLSPTWYGNMVVQSFKYSYSTPGVQRATCAVRGSGLWTLA